MTEMEICRNIIRTNFVKTLFLIRSYFEPRSSTLLKLLHIAFIQFHRSSNQSLYDKKSILYALKSDFEHIRGHG